MSRLVLPKLAFLIHIPDLYFHYRPVLDLLPQESFDIILPDEPPAVLLEIMEARQYHYAYISDLMMSRTMYKYLISDHIFLNDYHLMQELATHQIRLFSELGYDRLQLGNYNRLYDLILCFGRYQEQRLNFCKGTRFAQVGWPRYDAWFQEPDVDREALLDRLNCDRYRPVVLWLPTFGELSSIPAYAETISKLSDRYNIIVKPHDYTLLEEPEYLTLLYHNHLQTVLTDPFDELHLYFVTDCVLADYGNTP
ncbi:MAG TPA: CDP-glycerol glycerophosphotransferase family protein, partial [Candidatus Obscuribacterales bacterium]